MLLHISEQSDEPLQQQIVRQFRGRILSGNLRGEYPLPSIRILAKQLQVSVITVQRAYDALLNQGLIYSRRGKGFYVSPLEEDEKKSRASLRFKKQLTQVINSASNDGLSKDEIGDLFEKLLNEKNQE